MKKIVFLICLIIVAVTTRVQGQNPIVDLEDRYKQASMINYRDYGYYFFDQTATANEIAKELNLPLEIVHQLAVDGIIAALDFWKGLHNGFTKENYDAYHTAIDYFFANPDVSSKNVKVKFANHEIKLVLFMPIAMNCNKDIASSLQSDMEYMQQNIWRRSDKIKGYEVYVKKGQDWFNTAQQLKLSMANIKEYNPSIQIDKIAESECIIFIPTTPTYSGGNYAWSNMHNTEHYKILDAYALALVNGSLDAPLSVEEKLKCGRSLYYYDTTTIEGERFWYINNIRPETTANQIADAIGVSLDQLKLYCNYAYDLKFMDANSEMQRFNDVCQYYLSNPDLTIEQVRAASRNTFGRSYSFSIYIPKNPSCIKIDADGSIAFPHVIPTKFESSKDLRKFLAAAPKFKCAETGVEITLKWTKEDGYVAYVNGKEFGGFQTDLNKKYPTHALIGLPWLNGWGPAPMDLSLNGDKTTLSLLPVEGEENLSYNSRGYLQSGNTGRKGWMSLSLSAEGISFTPVNYKPNPQIFNFIEFTK